MMKRNKRVPSPQQLGCERTNPKEGLEKRQ